jgi:hypothetical protein
MEIQERIFDDNTDYVIVKKLEVALNLLQKYLDIKEIETKGINKSVKYVNLKEYY